MNSMVEASNRKIDENNVWKCTKSQNRKISAGMPLTPSLSTPLEPQCRREMYKIFGVFFFFYAHSRIGRKCNLPTFTFRRKCDLIKLANAIGKFEPRGCEAATFRMVITIPNSRLTLFPSRGHSPQELR